MTYLASTLVTNSWYLSGILARGLQVLQGDQIADGVQLLNNLLNFKQIEVDLVPYYTYIELPLVQGQETYFLPYVSKIESATFNISNVRYPMDRTSRTVYFGSSRVDSISSLPFNWHFERCFGGGNMSMYFLPESNYEMKMMVKLFLVDVTATTDLKNLSAVVPYTFINSSNQGLDTSYIEYLRYALAEYMCSEYGIVFNPQSAAILRKYERKLMYIGPPDLSTKKKSILCSSSLGGLNWGDVNLGLGWRPS